MPTPSSIPASTTSENAASAAPKPSVPPPAPAVVPLPSAKPGKLPAPRPMAGKGQPVDWMFAFKFNSASFPGCTDDGVSPPVGSKGIFGGTVQDYKKEGHSQQYVFATSANPALAKGENCLGGTLTDPLGATFGQVYNTPGYYYVLWNDQFYGNPIATKGAPAGHSKGMAAWNDDGEGFVLQVSTPSWPGSGSGAKPRQNDGNTLGCIKDDDVMVSQHFFALKLTKSDLAAVLTGLANASVVTDPKQPSIVNNGGPADIQALVNALGQESKSKTQTIVTLSTGVQFISKPSALAVPPWQMISAVLGGAPLRVASWWDAPAISSTGPNYVPQCWAPGLSTPGPVEIALMGQWDGTKFGLLGKADGDGNHAKVGVSTSGKPLSIFGDENQQGALRPDYDGPTQTCSSSQNGRGGTFYVLSDPKLHTSVSALLDGSTAPIRE